MDQENRLGVLWEKFSEGFGGGRFGKFLEEIAQVGVGLDPIDAPRRSFANAEKVLRAGGHRSKPEGFATQQP